MVDLCSDPSLMAQHKSESGGLASAKCTLCGRRVQFVLEHICESGGLASAKCTVLCSLCSVCVALGWNTYVKVVVWPQPNAHFCVFVFKPSLAFILLKA